YGWLAAGRLRRDPRTFPGAVGRALRARLPHRRTAPGSGTRCSVLPLDAPGAASPERVSVVLPVFDQADLLPEAIESVLAQSHRDLELIVVDDGSTDPIEPVLSDHAGDPRVRILRQPNLGLPAALTNGFRFASGAFATWTSADNVLEPDMLARLRARLRADLGLTMVYADYRAIDAAGRPLRGGDFRPLQRAGPDSPVIRLPRATERLNTGPDNFIGPCFLYRGFVPRVLPDWRGALGVEDWDYWMRLNATFRIEHLGDDATPYRYRWHPNSLNGRADRIRLLDKAQELMRTERTRARWRAAPWTVALDPELTECRPAPAPHVTVSGRVPEQARSLRIDAPERLADTPWEGPRVVVWTEEPTEAVLARVAPLLFDSPEVLHACVPEALDVVRTRAARSVAWPRDALSELAEFAIAWADAAGPFPAGRDAPPLPSPRLPPGQRPRVRVAGAGASEWYRSFALTREFVEVVPLHAEVDFEVGLSGTGLVLRSGAGRSVATITPALAPPRPEALAAPVARLLVWLRMGGRVEEARPWFREDAAAAGPRT